MTTDKETESKPESIPDDYWITDKQIENAWGNANFGEKRNQNRRGVILDTLLQIGGGFHTGYTAMTICKELGLVIKPKSRSYYLSPKGKRVMYYWNKHFNQRADRQAPQDVEALIENYSFKVYPNENDLDNDTPFARVMRELASQGHLTTPAQSVDVEGLHSKIDMDLEDEFGRELTLAESAIVGAAVSFSTRHLTPQPKQDEWRGIESAPKDGRTVELLNYRPQMSCVYTAWWMPHEGGNNSPSEEYDGGEGHCWVLNDDEETLIEEDTCLKQWYWRELTLPTPPKTEE